jgi:hypothetical protein
MTIDPVIVSWTASWIATGLGVGLWLWSWLGEKNAIQKLRYRDCGVVLVFSGVLLRVLVPAREMTAFDWAMVVMGPLFIAAALWRLSLTGTQVTP